MLPYSSVWMKDTDGNGENSSGGIESEPVANTRIADNDALADFSESREWKPVV